MKFRDHSSLPPKNWRNKILASGKKMQLIYCTPLKWVVFFFSMYIKNNSFLITDYLLLVALRYNYYLSEWKTSWVAKLEYRPAGFAQTRKLQQLPWKF